MIVDMTSSAFSAATPLVINRAFMISFFRDSEAFKEMTETTLAVTVELVPATPERERRALMDAKRRGEDIVEKI